MNCMASSMEFEASSNSINVDFTEMEYKLYRHFVIHFPLLIRQLSPNVRKQGTTQNYHHAVL
jgi:hypothetical protein